MNLPGSLAFDSAGNLYVSNPGFIEKFTPAGVGSLFATFGTKGPVGLAFDSAGNLYVSNFDSTIEKFTPGGVRSLFASTGLNGPNGLAFDSAGNLYAANAGNNTIEKFTPAGVGSIFAGTGLSGPAGLAFDSAGNLYAANSDNDTIVKFNPGGGIGSVFADASNGLNVPYFLAFTDDFGVPFPLPNQVPEPSPWVLLALSLAVLPGLSRPRRRA